MLYILDRNEQVVGLLQSNSDRNKNIYYDDVLTEMLSSGADTFTFTSIPDRETSEKLTVGNYIAFKKGNKFKLLQIIEVNESKEDVLTKEIYCEGAGLELINTVYSGSKMDSVNIKRFLINILQDTNWNVGYVDSNLTKTLSLDVEEKEVYSIIQEYLYDFEAEIDFRVEIKGNRIVGRYIDVYSKRGRNNGRRLEINRDIKSISRKVSLVNYATKLIGEGKNGLNFRDISMSGEINKPLGQNFVVNEETYSRINNKGKHITRKFTYDTEDAYELLRQTYKALKEYSEPKVTYEVDADILNFDDIEIGDYVSISDLSFTPPLLVTARISELETSKTNKYANKAILSNFNEVRSGISSIFPILGEDIVSGSIGEDQMNPDYVDSIISDSVNASMVKTEILLADKANIGDLNATNAEIENLKVNKAEITDLNATNANIDNLKANFAEIDELLAGNITAENIKADSITSDHIQANTIDTKHLKADIIDAEHINANSITSNHIQSNTIDARHINSNSINADHIQANTITSGHIQTGSITAGSGIIADGAIGNAQISQIDAGKIEAGTIDTSKVTIQGANGHLRLKGNRMQVFQGTGNQAKERVSVGDVNGDGSVYGLRVRGADGQTILLDENGVKSEGITDGSITNDKISDDANIDGAKLNINSVVSKINEDGTETIQGTKIEVDGTTLNTKLSTITNKQTEDSERITQAQSQITANTNAIKLKVDEQTYTTDKKDMTSKLEKNTSEISTMKGQIALKVEQTDIENAKSELEGTMDSKIEGLQVGGRNLIRKANVIQNNSTATFNESTKTWTIKASAGAGGTWGCGLVLSSKNILVPYGKSYVLSFEIKVPRNCRWNVDINNYALIGSSWAGNDNDNTSKRTASSKNLTANQWIKCWVKWENTNTNNTTKVDLYDNSNFGVVMQNETSDMTYEIRNIQGELGNMPTEYTPAPEDVDGAINSVDSKVDTLRTEYNSTKSKVATIETNLSGITSRVSSAETNIEKISNASSQNLLYNSDFRIINGSLPDGWSVSDSSKITLDRNSSLLDGIPTFWFNVTGLTENAWKAVYSPFIEAKAGEKFVASAYVIGYNKWSTLDNGASLEIEYYNDSSRISTVSAGVNKSNLNWQRLVVKGTAPTGTTRVRIRVHPIKNGQFNMSKPMLQYGETVTGWDRGFDIKNLTTRLKTAESKITDDAITNTVKKNFYTKSETDSQITSKGYQTASQVQQTVNGLQVKVEQSGGYNNLLNSQFRKGTSYWSNQIYGTATNNSISTWNDSNQYILPNTCSLVIRGTNVTDRYGVHQVVDVKAGATYSIFALSAGHRNTKQLITIRRSDTGGHLLNIEVDPSSAGKNINNWRKMKGTFTVPSDVTSITVCLYLKGNGTNNDAYAWFTNVTLSEGQLVEEWSPHPSEVYDGITTIDKDGITVTSSNVKSKTSMTSSGFKITKTDTNEDVFKVNADGTLYMKGQITVTGGSVPTSNLSGTISSNQLNSSITNDISTAKNNASNAVSTANTAKSTADSAKTTATTANNTANSVKSTVDSNSPNWSNAYNRVKEWASGAVTGTTTINGGMISANTITASKLALMDFTNYSQLNEKSASSWGFSYVNETSGTKYTMNSISRDKYISETHLCNGGETFRIKGSILTTCKGYLNSSATSATYLGTAIGIYCYNGTGSSVGIVYSKRVTATSTGTETTIDSTVTIPSTARKFRIFVQTEGVSNFSGTIMLRNIQVLKCQSGELIVDGAITANKIASGAITAGMITTGTLDASKVNVTNLNASNIKSGKLSANYIDATNLAVKGSLISGQINGVGGIKFADGAVISSYDSHVPGYKGIKISAPSINLGDKVDIATPTLFGTVTGRSSSSATSSSWTMSSSGALTCASATTSGQLKSSTLVTTSSATIGSTLNVKNNAINGMNNLAMARGSVNIPIFGANYTYDYIKGGASRIAFADSGPIHFLYNGSKSSFIAGGTVYLPHAGNANCDHFRLGSGIMASPSSGSFHFLTASGNTSPLYAGRLYSADVRSASEPMVISNNSAFDKINSVNVIETKNGLNLHNPISTTNDIDESPDVVKTVYNEEKDEIKTSIDYTSAISTLWKAVQELKQENNELKEIIKSLCPKE